MQRLRRKLAWMLVGLLLAHDGVWAASELPELGDASQDVLTPQMQRRLGEGFYNEIRLRDPAYIDDPEISMRTECVPLNPVAIPINIMFLFPDRRAVLDLFDNETTGFERFVAVRRADGDDDAGCDPETIVPR